jgi:hypothetical protein
LDRGASNPGVLLLPCGYPQLEGRRYPETSFFQKYLQIEDSLLLNIDWFDGIPLVMCCVTHSDRYLCSRPQELHTLDISKA